MPSSKNRRRGGKPSRSDRVAARRFLPEGWCAKCHAPQCLALVRADTAPANWKDLIDRQLKLISSGHWGTAQIGYLGALLTIGALVAAMVGWLLFTIGPVGTGLLGGSAMLTGTALRIHNRHRRNAVAIPRPDGGVEG